MVGWKGFVRLGRTLKRLPMMLRITIAKTEMTMLRVTVSFCLFRGRGRVEGCRGKAYHVHALKALKTGFIVAAEVKVGGFEECR